MGELVLFRGNGHVTRRRPSLALSLESGCDWGYCTRPGVAWRWLDGHWLVVCVRCIAKPMPTKSEASK